jgi:hypothetical protein
MPSGCFLSHSELRLRGTAKFVTVSNRRKSVVGRPDDLGILGIRRNGTVLARDC